MKNIYNAPEACVLALAPTDVIASSPLTYKESGAGNVGDWRQM